VANPLKTTEEGPRLVKRALEYLVIGVISYVGVEFLERLATNLGGILPKTEIYSLHGFSHVFFGIGLVSILVFLKPKMSPRVLILTVLLMGVVWELHEGLWLRGEPLDSLEDVVLSILSASTFLSLRRKEN
jgi:hypothetical protein